MTKPAKIIVRAMWDEEAKVWVASSTDIDGLAAEGSTIDELFQHVIAAIEDLLEVNGLCGDTPDIPVHLMAEQIAHVRNPRHSC